MNRTILDLNGVSRTTAGVTSVNGRYGAVTIASADVTAALGFTPYSAANPSGFIAATGAPVQSVFGRTGTVALLAGDVTGALGFTPGIGTVTSVIAGAGLAGGTITGAGTLSLATTAAGSLLGNAGTTAAVAGAIAIGAGVSLSAAGTLSNSGVVSFNGRTGAVTQTSGDVTGALGFTPGTGSVTSVIAGSGLAGGTITGTGTISLATIAAGSLHGNPGTASAVPTSVAIGAGVSLSAAGTLSNSGVVSFNGRTGAVTPTSGDVTGALGFTPGTVTSVIAGSGLAGGTITGAGTISLATTAASSLLGNAGTTAAVAGAITIGAGVSLSAAGTLSNNGVVSFNGRTGAVTPTSGDVTGALGFTPGTGSVTSVIAGSGLAGGTITGAGTISLATIAAASLHGNPGTVSAVPTAVAIGAGVSLSAAGTLSNSGVVSFNGRTGAVTPTSGDVTGALGFTPGTVTSVIAGSGLAGGTITGTGTLSLATTAASSLVGNPGTTAAVAGAIIVGSGLLLSTAGTLTAAFAAPPPIGNTTPNTGAFTTLTIGTSVVDVAVTNTTDTGGNAVIVYLPGGSTTGQISQRLDAKNGYIQLADVGSFTSPNFAGAEAIDLQLDRNAATQVASGNRAVALGAQNTVTGTRAAAIGYGNTASGQGSVVLGQGANDNGTSGVISFNGGNIGCAWTGQISGVSGAGTAIRLTSNGSAAAATNVFQPGANAGLGGQLTVTARNVATGDVALWLAPILFQQGSAAASFVLAPAATVSAMAPTMSTGSTLATASLAIAGDTTNGGLSVTVTPPSGVTIHASAVLSGALIS